MDSYPQAPWNTSGGANFVDFTLRVIVLQERGTLLAHRQEHPHGTTRSHGAVNWALSIVFSDRLAKMWQKTQIEQLIEQGEGAGPQDHDDL